MSLRGGQLLINISIQCATRSMYEARTSAMVIVPYGWRERRVSRATKTHDGNIGSILSSFAWDFDLFDDKEAPILMKRIIA
jgi:hypothetical protein